MVQSKFVRATAVALTSVGLIVGLGSGIAGASSGSISDTGPDSSNKILSIFKNDVEVSNDTHASLSNENNQLASSGSATVSDNTTGGSAKTGSATNTNSTKATLTVVNAMPAMSSANVGGTGSIKDTGPSSDNKILFVTKNDVEVSNDTSICIDNSNLQSATTGDATVSHNTSGGSATTGNASNANTSSFSLSVTN